MSKDKKMFAYDITDAAFNERLSLSGLSGEKFIFAQAYFNACSALFHALSNLQDMLHELVAVKRVYRSIDQGGVKTMADLSKERDRRVVKEIESSRKNNIASKRLVREVFRGDPDTWPSSDSSVKAREVQIMDTLKHIENAFKETKKIYAKEIGEDNIKNMAITTGMEALLKSIHSIHTD